MKRIISLLVAMVIFLSACGSPAVSTSAPVEQVEATSTLQPAEVVPVENTATSTPEQTLTPTPVPPSPRWYWTVDDSGSAKVIAVNQFGERREIGALDQSDDLHTTAVSLDHERALLFLDNDDTLRVYLLTPDGMQKITLPSDPFYFNTEAWQPSRAVIAMHGGNVLFSYVTEGSSNLMPDTGPILLIDLNALTTKLIDEQVHRDPHGNNHYWFHTSQDGRYLRYQNGDRKKMDIRELDMVTGEARTLFTTNGSPFSIRTSPQGDLWYLRETNNILDLNGNQIPFTDELQAVRPLKDGNVAIYPRECVDDCEIKVFTPFRSTAELTYKFPWAIESASLYNSLDQVLPDQSLLVAGRPSAFLSNSPAAAAADYPDLLGEDSPLFRLMPDGQARLVGIYTGNVSDDGHYMLLRSSDQASFFIYDVIADRTLFDMPIDTTLEDYYVTARFLDMGILVSLSPSVPGEKGVYRFFYHAYVYETSASIAWEDVNAEIGACPDLLEDGTLVCWFYQADPTSISYDLVRFDPVTGAKTLLLENAWLIEFTP